MRAWLRRLVFRTRLCMRVRLRVLARYSAIAIFQRDLSTLPIFLRRRLNKFLSREYNSRYLNVLLRPRLFFSMRAAFRVTSISLSTISIVSFKRIKSKTKYTNATSINVCRLKHRRTCLNRISRDIRSMERRAKEMEDACR